MELGADGADPQAPAPGETLLRAWRIWLPPILAAVAAAAGIAVLAYTPLPGTALQAGGCPASDSWRAPSAGAPLFTDNNVAQFVGGDYRSTGAAQQSEGLVVIMGDAVFDTGHSGVTQVGTIAVGSRAVPSPGSVMLAVGGTLHVLGQGQLGVGGGGAAGGRVVVGRSVISKSVVRSNGGGIRQGLGSAATAQFRDFTSELLDESNRLAGRDTTGTVDLVASTLYFTGDGASRNQVFTLDGQTLGSGEVIDFKNIPPAASVIVNVTGSAALIDPRAFDQGGVDVGNPPSNAGAEVAAHTLWNFEQASSVRIAGTTPILGTLLVPNGSVTLTNDVDGRLYVANNLTESGSAIVHSNYPWLGPSTFGCHPQPVAAFTAGSNSHVHSDGSELVRDILGLFLIALATALLVWWLIERAWRKRG